MAWGSLGTFAVSARGHDRSDRDSLNMIYTCSPRRFRKGRFNICKYICDVYRESGAALLVFWGSSRIAGSALSLW